MRPETALAYAAALRSGNLHRRLVNGPTRYDFQRRLARHSSPDAAVEEHNQHRPDAPLELVSATDFMAMYRCARPRPIVRDVFFQDAVEFAKHAEAVLRGRGLDFYGWRSSTGRSVLNTRFLEEHDLWIVNREPPELLLNKDTVAFHDEPRDDRVALVHHRDAMEREQFVWFCSLDEPECTEVYAPKQTTRSNAMVVYVDRAVLDRCEDLDRLLDDGEDKLSRDVEDHERFLVHTASRESGRPRHQNSVDPDQTQWPTPTSTTARASTA